MTTVIVDWTGLDAQVRELSDKLSAAEQRAVEAERRADKVGAYVDDLRADWQDAEKRAEAAAEERDDWRRMHESADVRAQAAEAERDTLKAQVAGLQALIAKAYPATWAADSWERGGVKAAEAWEKEALQALSAAPSTRTAALLRAGEAACEETRTGDMHNDLNRRYLDDDVTEEMIDAAADAHLLAVKARRAACAAVPGADPGREKENG